jgi:hypothetical protein
LPKAHTNGHNGHTNALQPATPKEAKRQAPFVWEKATLSRYKDEKGAPLFEVGRCDAPGCEKAIRQRRPAPETGGYIYGLSEGLYEPQGADFYPVKPGQEPSPNARQFPEARRVLWRLYDLTKAETVYVCEGEKAAERLNEALHEAGLYVPHVATTAPQGAGKWRPEFSQAFAGKTVVVLPDNDPQGAGHGAQVCKATSGLASSLRLCELPGLPEKGDVCDFFDAGGALEKILELVEALPEWKPQEEQLAEAEATPMFEVFSYRQLRARPRLSWLIDQVLPTGGTDGSTSWLTAGAGELKSFWAIDAALCIATGREFHGRSVKAGNVVYVAAEGANGLPDRLEAWAIRNGCEVPDVPNFGIIECPADVANPEVLAGFVASIYALSPTFIVLDTQSRCSVGRDLNSTAEATVFYDAVSQLARKLGAQVLVLAHNNRNGQYAGNHQGPAMVATHLSLKRDGKYARLRCIKQKDGAPEEAAAMDFQACVVELGAIDEKGREITSLVLDSTVLAPEPEKREREDLPAKRRAQVLEVLAVQFPGGAKASEWQEAVEKAGIAKASAFYNCLYALVDSRAVRKTVGRYLAVTKAEE